MEYFLKAADKGQVDALNNTGMYSLVSTNVINNYIE